MVQDWPWISHPPYLLQPQLGQAFSQRRKCVIRLTVATTGSHLLLEGPATIRRAEKSEIFQKKSTLNFLQLCGVRFARSLDARSVGVDMWTGGRQ